MSFVLDDPIDKIFSCVECGHPLYSHNDEDMCEFYECQCGHLPQVSASGTGLTQR